MSTASENDPRAAVVRRRAMEQRPMTGKNLERHLAALARKAGPLLASLGPTVGEEERIRALVETAVPPQRRISESATLRRILRALTEFELGTPLAYYPGLHMARAFNGRMSLPSKPSPTLFTSEYLVRLQSPSRPKSFGTFPLADAEVVHVGPDYHSIALAIDGTVLELLPFRERDQCERAVTAILAAQTHDPADTAAQTSSGARPALRLIRTAAEAEGVAAEWMTYLGFGSARVTGAGADGGLDVIADRGVAQVKMEGLPLGRPVVQQLHGCACVEGKAGVVFALAGYTAEAAAWADRAGVALYAFDLQGEPVPVNSAARRLMPGTSKSKPTRG